MPHSLDNAFEAAFGVPYETYMIRNVKPKRKVQDEMAVLEAKPEFLFGCDPEIFLFKDGKPIAPDGIIPGTKEEPFQVPDGAIQCDGMAAEINIEPAGDFATFNRRISSVIGSLEKMLPEGVSLDYSSAVEFSPEVFAAASDEAKELGCIPDFNAWTGEVNPTPDTEKTPYLRCAGGHVHIGWTKDMPLSDEIHFSNCIDLVKQLDWYVGAYGVTMDSDPRRRLLYGKAGAFRPKDYGVEYRTPSNYWITTRERRLMLWNRVQMAISRMAQGYLPNRVDADTNDMLVNYINDSVRDKTVENILRFPIITTDIYQSRI